MSLLAPLFLFGLIAALIPVAIHLIRKDKPPQVVFSTLRFFEKTTRKQFLFQQFQQWLLLLLRALVICLLVFAFARPFFGQNITSLANNAPRSIAVALDTSMSMGYDNYFEIAKSTAIKIISELNQGDEATLVLFADEVKTVHGPTTDLESLKDAIQDLNAPTHYATRLFPPLRLANDILKEGRFEEKAIYLLSDFQASGMEDFDLTYKLSPGVELFLEQIPNNSAVSTTKNQTKNLTVTGVKAPAFVRIGTESEPQEIFVRVRSVGNVKVNQSELSVFIDEEKIATLPVDLEDKSEQIISVPVTFSKMGTHVGKVTLDDGDFETDNSAYFTVDVLPQLNVLVINGESSPNWYDDESHWFNLAIGSNQLTGEGASSEGASPFSVTTIDANLMNTNQSEEKMLIDDQLKMANVVVLLNVGDMSSRVASALNDYVTQGGNVFIALGDRVRAGEFNQQLSAISPATLIDRSIFSNNEYLLISDIKNRHPILQPIDIDWSVRFDGFWSMRPADNAEVLMTFDNGKPALVERQVGKGSSIIFGSSLDVEWNNFPLQSSYLPFVHETLKYLAHMPDKKSSYRVGERVVLIDKNKNVDGAENGLTDPTGETVKMSSGNGNSAELTEELSKEQSKELSISTAPSFIATIPGIYQQVVNTIQTESSGERKFATVYYAVNNPVEESNLQTIAPGDILDAVLNPETTPTQSAAVRSQLLKEELEKPQRIWWWILLAVFFLLITESVMANKAHR